MDTQESPLKRERLEPQMMSMFAYGPGTPNGWPRVPQERSGSVLSYRERKQEIELRRTTNQQLVAMVPYAIASIGIIGLVALIMLLITLTA